MSIILAFLLECIYAPDYWANTPGMRQSLFELRTSESESLEEIAKKICHSGNTRSHLMLVGCLQQANFLERLGTPMYEDVPEPYHPLRLLSNRIIDTIASSNSPYRENLLYLLHSGPHSRFKLGSPHARWHSDLSEQGHSLGFPPYQDSLSKSNRFS